MTIEWFNKAVGSEMAQSQDDPHMMLMGVCCPDLVRVPHETGHGGVYRCLGVQVAPCPVAGHQHQCRHYILDGPVWAAECHEISKFLWYKSPEIGAPKNSPPPNP